MAAVVFAFGSGVGVGGEAGGTITGADFSYLAERLVVPDGEGIIHVNELVGANTVFADGFEGGDTTAWSD